MQPAKPHLSVVPKRAVKAIGPALTGIRSRLGHAALIGGVGYVERAAYSDAVMQPILALDAAGRREAIRALPGLVEKATQKARALPTSTGRPPRARRVKVRWSDETIARFKAEAMRCADNVELAKRLGLPAYCEGAMRAARSRYFRGAAIKPPSRPTGRPSALRLAMAA